MSNFLKFLTGVSHFCMSPDDGNGGGGGGNGDGGDKKEGGDDNKSMLDVDAIKKGAENTDPNADPNKQVTNDDPNKKQDDVVNKPGDKMTRPEWLKEDKFWDDEKGEVKSEDILKSYRELEKKFTAGDHKAPAKAEDYKLSLNDDQKKVLFGKSEVDAAAMAADPGIKSLANWGVKHKISQDALNDLLGEYTKFVEPELTKYQVDVEAEKAVLGKNADAIIKNQFDFLGHLYRSGHINDKHLEEAKILMETAAGVQILQKIREYYGEQPIPTNLNTSGDGMPTREELSAMLNDPKYETDPDHKAKVDALYAKRYGTSPAMSSAQNR